MGGERGNVEDPVVVIREATIEDASAISALVVPITEKFIAHKLSPDGARILLESMEPEKVEGYFRAGHAYHVAEYDSQIIGVVAVRDNSHLFNLFVAEEYQRRGYARKLWEVARDACLKRGKTGQFTVKSSTFAVGVYHKFGFAETGPPETIDGVTSIPMAIDVSANTIES